MKLTTAKPEGLRQRLRLLVHENLLFLKLFKYCTAFCSVSVPISYLIQPDFDPRDEGDQQKMMMPSILKRCLISSSVHVIALLRVLRYSTPSLSLSAALLVCVAFLPSACI